MLQGRINRIRLLWVNRDNPKEVNNISNILYVIFSTFWKYELIMGEQNKLYAVIKQTNSLTSGWKKCVNVKKALSPVN